MSDTNRLAAAIAEIVRATPGVAEIYSARPLALTVADQLAQAALPALPALPSAQLISVSGDAELLTAQIRIAITEDAPAADICRDVYTAVSQHLAAQGVAKAEITVTVARVVDR